VEILAEVLQEQLAQRVFSAVVAGNTGALGARSEKNSALFPARLLLVSHRPESIGAEPYALLLRCSWPRRRAECAGPRRRSGILRRRHRGGTLGWPGSVRAAARHPERAAPRPGRRRLGSNSGSCVADTLTRRVLGVLPFSMNRSLARPRSRPARRKVLRP